MASPPYSILGREVEGERYSELSGDGEGNTEAELDNQIVYGDSAAGTIPMY